jgi:hypothetical protein
MENFKTRPETGMPSYSNVKLKQLIISRMVQKDGTSPWSATIKRASPFYGSSVRLQGMVPQFYVPSHEK